MKKRSYNNSLRAKQAAQTRDAILDALLGLLAQSDVTRLSMAKIAQAAGVSQATLFRHFENKEQLFRGLSERAYARFKLPPRLADELTEVSAKLDDLFGYFEGNRELLSAVNRIPDVAQYAASVRRERMGRTRELVVARYPRLSEAEQEEAVALFHLLFGAQGWRTLVEGFGLSQERAVAAARLGFEALVEKLDRIHEHK